MALLVAVTADLTAKIKAGNIIKHIAPIAPGGEVLRNGRGAPCQRACIIGFAQSFRAPTSSVQFGDDAATKSNAAPKPKEDKL